MTTRVPVDFEDNILEEITLAARREGRSIENWLDLHFRLHFYGAMRVYGLIENDSVPSFPPRYRRDPIAAENRRAAYEFAGGKCSYCSAILTPFNFEVDHVVPVAKGGKNSPDNLVASCRSCNKKKHVKDVAEFSAIKERR